MSKINYNHNENTHTVSGPKEAFKCIFPSPPKSLLDVGCGTGSWMNAARESGIKDIFGVDGIDLGSEALYSREEYKKIDLTFPWDLGRKFDAAICLEVAEHLDENFAYQFIKNITNHTDTIVFSAASVYQPGQHHVNCQWPLYWQEIFNRNGFECIDNLRDIIWENNEIEAWYRQNIFTARKSPNAGKEKRILGKIHPELYPLYENYAVSKAIESERAIIIKKTTDQIYLGSLPAIEYPKILITAAIAKLGRIFK
jgi:SAM-dependent methyltransferase